MKDFAKKRPTLSVCLIARNEERLLPACLQSVSGWAEEIIVVDTGSTDRTPQIAKESGAKVFAFGWQNDFAAARNESLSKATQEWILVLDADEVVSASAKAQIDDLLTHSSALLFYLIQTTYAEESATFGWIPNYLKDPEAQGYAGFIESPLVRLFRNIPQIRFQGRIHEHAFHEDRKILPAKTPIRIHHYGKYIPAPLNEKKNLLYLELGRKKCLENSKDAHAFYELGVQCWSMERMQEAKESLEQALKIDPKYSKCLIAMAIVLTVEKKYQEAIGMYARLLEIEPQNILPYLYLPPLLMEIGNLSLAEEILKAGEFHAAFHPCFHINQGVVRKQMGNFRGAIASFNEALRLNPNESLAWLNQGMAWMDLREWDLAKESLDKARTFSRQRLLATEKLAEWHFLQKGSDPSHLEKGLECLKEVYREIPKDASNLLNMGIFLIQLKRKEEARSYLNQIHSLEGLKSEEKERLYFCATATGAEKVLPLLGPWEKPQKTVAVKEKEPVHVSTYIA